MVDAGGISPQTATDLALHFLLLSVIDRMGAAPIRPWHGEPVTRVENSLTDALRIEAGETIGATDRTIRGSPIQEFCLFERVRERLPCEH